MALLILIAALWGIVLLPTLLKRRTARRQVGSIDHFHHQLHLLEQAGPKIVAPAYRLETAESQVTMAVGASGYPTISSAPARPNLVLLRPVAPGQAGDDEVVDDATGDHYQRVRPPALVGVPAPGADAEPKHTAVERRRGPAADAEHARLREARLRRRNFLALLVGTMVFTGLLGLVPSLHGLWVITAMSALGLAAYVTLAVMAMRNDVDAARVARAGARWGRRLPPKMPSVTTVDSRQSLAAAGFPGAWDNLDDGAQEVPGAALAGGPSGGAGGGGAGSGVDAGYEVASRRVAAR